MNDLTAKDIKTKEFVNKWIDKIQKTEERLKKKHREYAEKAEKQYYNDCTRKIDVPIYWSTIETQRSALYNSEPSPEIRGRNNDVTNPLSKQISKVLEEAISYEIDQSDFYSDADRAILDYLLTDLGQVRIKYDVETGEQYGSDGLVIVDEEGEPIPQITNQNVVIDHWPWKRFIYDIGKDWAECDWVCYLHYMSRKEVKKEYDIDVQGFQIDTKENSSKNGKATIYEVWDKTRKRVYHLMSGEKKPLKVIKDPLRLKGFFDCPKPLISNMKSDKYIPQSDYVQIEQQIKDINVLQGRINALTKSLRDVGFYDASVNELNKLQAADDGKLVPIDGLRSLLDGSTNFENVIAKLPIINQAQVIQLLEQQKKEAKEQLYETTGSSDITRGTTKASETATAQQIKGQWQSVRLHKKQKAIARWFRGILRIQAEVIAEHFTADQLTRMTGVQVTPEMQQIMQNDLLRCYAIDIETDSTIQADESQDKADRMEMVNTFLPLLQNILPAVNQNMMPMELGKAILLTAVRGFKYTRAIEDMIEGMGDNMSQLQQLQQQLQQGQQQMQQMDMQYQQQLQQQGQQMQQMGQALQKANQDLAQVDQAENQLKAIETQAEAGKDAAETKKKEAETAKIWQELNMNSQVAMNPYQVGV